MKKREKKYLRYGIYILVLLGLLFYKFYRGTFDFDGEEGLNVSSSVAENNISGETGEGDFGNFSEESSGGTFLSDDVSSKYGTVFGYVTDSFGNPVRNIAVELLPFAEISNIFFGKTRKSFTDKNGMYKFSKVSPGFYTFLMFSHRNDIYVGAGDKLRRDFKLEGEGAVSGHVIDNGGNPIFPANVYAIGTSLRYREVTETDELGKYRLYGLPDGKYFIYVRADGYELLPGKKVSIEGGEEICDVNFILGVGCVLEGFVRNSDGEPQKDVYVSTVKVGNRLGTSYARTDATGYYRIDDLSPGINYFLLWKKNSYTRSVGSVFIRENEVNRRDFIFNGGSSICGSVNGYDLDFLKYPVRIALFRIGDKKRRITGSSLVYADENGHFCFNSLEAGKYRVKISKCSSMDYIFGGGKIVVLDAGERQDVVLNVFKGGKLIVKLLDNSDDPVKGVMVYIHTLSGKLGAKSQILNTDENGKAVFRGLSEGVWDVEVKDKDYLPLKKRISVGYGEEKKLTLKLKKGIVLSGHVVDRDENPLPNITVICRLLGDDKFLFVRRTLTDSSGFFKIDNLKRGRYLIFLTYKIDKSHTKVFTKRLNLTDSKDVILKTNIIRH